MSEAGQLVGEVHIRRFVDQKHGLVLVRGNFEEFYRAFLGHIEKWGNLSDGLALVMMRQGLAAAALHLSCRPRDEFIAWTLNIRNPPLNVFLTGNNVESSITGRVYTEGVKTTESSRLFVESQRPQQPPIRSMVEVDGLDLMDIFEQYYSRSEQNVARFVELGELDFVMILGLPNINESWLRTAKPKKILEDSGSELHDIGSRIYRFQCGCNPLKILEVARGIYKNQPEELFNGKNQVEAFCPRCGRRFWLSRDDFDSWAGKVGLG